MSNPQIEALYEIRMAAERAGHNAFLSALQPILDQFMPGYALIDRRMNSEPVRRQVVVTLTFKEL